MVLLYLDDLVHSARRVFGVEPRMSRGGPQLITPFMELISASLQGMN